MYDLSTLRSVVVFISTLVETIYVEIYIVIWLAYNMYGLGVIHIKS